MRFPRKYARIALLVICALFIWATVLVASADALPRNAQHYQRDLTRHARNIWGMDAPVAMFGAQIHQESRWRTDAQSTVGAQGIAQIMPGTAEWVAGAYKLGEPQPYSPGWAMRALVNYDRYLWQQIDAANPCERAAMMLSAYNGGLGWVYRDQQLAAKNGHDRRRWFSMVELFNAGRSKANFDENRNYPRVILIRWQPIYTSWGGTITCS